MRIANRSVKSLREPSFSGPPPAIGPQANLRRGPAARVSPRILLLALASAAGSFSAQGNPLFQFPTANQALLEPDGGPRFFAGTAGKDWTTGQFGCVRTFRQQMHEGLDIKCITRDRRGEPADPVRATADGVVVYLNRSAALSNYGRYIVIRHRVEGLEIYSLYAHLQSFHPELKPGDAVRQGQEIAIMGRTSNTRERIGKDRAHVHFELNLLINDRFPAWHKRNFPKQRNDHGIWNGQNLAGIDPAPVLIGCAKNPQFSVLEFIRGQRELCRVWVRAARFPWIRRYAPLVRRNPVAEKEGIAGYEMALNFNGIPFRLIPRAASEVKGTRRFELLRVDAAEEAAHPCRHLVARRRGHWVLTAKGIGWLDLLAF